MLRLKIAGLVVLVTALLAVIGWKTIISSGHLPDTPEYKLRLKETGDNIANAPKDPDDGLKLYTVYVAHTAPFEKPFVGYGIYLGHGGVLTAAHVVGRWPLLTNPRILIAGQDLPATVVKQGAPETIDLTVLSVDETKLPISLRLRRNPLCDKDALAVNRSVVVATPETAKKTHIISPLQISPRYRKRFYSLMADVGPSGAGVFDANKKCLLGIVSRKITKLAYRNASGHLIAEPAGDAGYFVPATRIADFLPQPFRF